MEGVLEDGKFCDRHPFEGLVRGKINLGTDDFLGRISKYWEILRREVGRSDWEECLCPASCLATTVESIFGECKALCLASELRKVVKEFSGKGATIHLEMKEDVGLGASARALIFCHNYVCEALGNSLKHGKASEIQIIVEGNHDWLEVAVCDNGRWKDAEGKNGIGLTLSRKYVNEAGGRFKVGQNSLGGVTTEVKLPKVEPIDESLLEKDDRPLTISLTKLPRHRVVAEISDDRWLNEKIRERFIAEVMTRTKFREPLWKYSTTTGGMIVLARDQSKGGFDAVCQREYLKANSPFGRELQGRLANNLHNQYGQMLSGAMLSLELLMEELSEEKNDLWGEGKVFLDAFQREARESRDLSHRLHDYLNGLRKRAPLLE